MPYLHLPVQSGSDRILAAMNRRHTRADYLAVVDATADGAAGHRALLRFHRRLSRARPRRISARRSRSSTRSAMPAPSRSSTRRGRARPPPRAPTRCRKRTRPSGSRGCSRRIDRNAHAFNTRLLGRSFDVLFEKAGPASRPDGRPLALSAAGAGHGADIIRDRRDRAGVRITLSAPTACSERWRCSPQCMTTTRRSPAQDRERLAPAARPTIQP